LEERIANPAFWSEQTDNQKILQRRKQLENEIALDAKLQRAIGDLETFFEQAGRGVVSS
jgi:hypothetical protein